MAEEIKRLRYVRHSLKDGANNTIGPKGLAYAQEKAPAGNYTDLFYGQLYRTVQSVLAVIAAVGCAPGTRVHTPIAEIGDDDAVKEIVTADFQAAAKTGKTNIQAFWEAHRDNRDLVAKWLSIFSGGVKKMFDEMPKGGFGLALGHDPFIVLASHAFGYLLPALKEMEYLDFVLYDDGSITVEDPRK